MANWNANHYLKYGDERTRAAADLVTRIPLDAPTVIADLGCGPGNSTELLRRRWPAARILGVDSSPTMIDAAKAAFPDHEWHLADLSDWIPPQPINLAFSNAALHWIPNHDKLIPRLFDMVAPGGALAFQIPSSTYPTVRKLVHEVSRDARWVDRMHSPRNALTMQPPSFYYDILISSATDCDIWETEYIHVMDSKDSIVDWISSTGLRPFLAALNDHDERNSFLIQLKHLVAENYDTCSNGKVLFPFRRTFVIAYR